MRNTVKISRPRTTPRQKTLSTLANANSVVGHTAGVFGGVVAGVNIAKSMESNGINSGVSVATGIVSALVIAAGVSIATECVSGAIRRKAGIASPFAMLCTQNDFNPEDYDFLLETVDEDAEEFIEEDEEEQEELSGDS